MSTSPLDFVTICFEKEAGLLRLQARSFAQFVDPKCVGTIYLVPDHGVTQRFQEYLEAVVMAEYRHLSNRVKILQMPSINSPCFSHSSGWRRQQALKIMSALLVQSECFVIMDGKNHFILPVRSDDFVTNDNRTIQVFETKPIDALLPAFEASMGVFHLPAGLCLEGPQPNTPYPIHTELIRDMISWIEKTKGEPFEEWFLQLPFREWVTEFYLIKSYVLYRFGCLDTTFKFIPARSWGIWPLKFRNGLSVKSVLHVIKEHRMSCMCVHSAALAELNEQEKAEIINFWNSNGLSVDDDDAKAIFNDRMF